jgi:nucleoside-diphosphate-sugar epimerase
METLHHVHADDVGEAFQLALTNWNHAVGGNFNVTFPSALTLRGYAEAIANWFGVSGRLRFLPWDE